MNDIKKKTRKEKIVEIGWVRKTPGYIRTTLGEEYASGHNKDYLRICMIAQHVTWLQKEFDELKHNHDLLQQRFDEMAEKMNMLWMAPSMPGAIMGSQHYIDNVKSSTSDDE